MYYTVLYSTLLYSTVLYYRAKLQYKLLSQILCWRGEEAVQAVEEPKTLRFSSIIFCARYILHVQNRIEIMLNNLFLLEWEFKTHRSRSAILFGKTMRCLNQISRTYSFESTKISI